MTLAPVARLRLSTYSTSAANFSSQVRALRPRTWARPVTPGRTSWRRACCGRVALQVLHEQRPRPDQAHVAPEHVPQRRQLVEAGASAASAERRQPLPVGDQPSEGCGCAWSGTSPARRRAPPCPGRACRNSTGEPRSRRTSSATTPWTGAARPAPSRQPGRRWRASAGRSAAPGSGDHLARRRSSTRVELPSVMRRAGGQGQAVLEQPVGGAVEGARAPANTGWQVHRLPHRPGLDAGGGQRAAQVVAGPAGGRRVDQDRGQPAVVLGVVVPPRIATPGGVGEQRAVALPPRRAAGRSSRPGVRAGPGPGRPGGWTAGSCSRSPRARSAARLAGLGGQLPDVRCQLPVVGEQHAAAGRGHDLVAVEGHDRGIRRTAPAGAAGVARPSDSAASLSRPARRAARRPLDARCSQRTCPACRRDDRRHRGALGAQRAVSASLEQLGVEVAGGRVAVDEVRARRRCSRPRWPWRRT